MDRTRVTFDLVWKQFAEPAHGVFTGEQGLSLK